MAANLPTDIYTARDNLIARIVTVSADIKPTYSIQGQSISGSDYYKMLLQALKDTNELLGEIDPVIIQNTSQV